MDKQTGRARGVLDGETDGWIDRCKLKHLFGGFSSLFLTACCNKFKPGIFPLLF